MSNFDVLVGQNKGRTFLDADPNIFSIDAQGQLSFSAQLSEITMGKTYSNLSIIPNAITPLRQVDIAFDYMWVGGIRIGADTETIIMPALGASGGNLDTGVNAVSTWYYIWIATNGVNVIYRFSASSTAPTLPAGYVHRRCIGAVYCVAATGNIRPVRQKNDFVILDTQELLHNAAASMGADLDINISIFVPLIFKGLAQLTGNCQGSQAGNPTQIEIYTKNYMSGAARTYSLIGRDNMVVNGGTALQYISGFTYTDVRIITFRATAIAGGGTSFDANLYLSGYEIIL